MECIVIVEIMKNATMKGLIAFDFGSFVKSKRPVAQTLSINYAYDNRTTKNVHNCIQYSLYLMTLYGRITHCNYKEIHL